MSQTKTNSPLDSEPYFELVKDLIQKGETNASIVRILANPSPTGKIGIYVSKDSIRRFRQRHEINPGAAKKAYVNVDYAKGQATGAGDVTGVPVLLDPDQMLIERGLDPSEWFIDNVRPNEWTGPGVDGAIIKYFQTSFSAKLITPPFARPARSEGWIAPKKRKAIKKSKLVVVVGDQQAPYHDPKLHELFCAWLDENKPDEGVSLGDTFDFPDISRHPSDPENEATVNECLQEGYNVFRGYVNSSPDTTWQKLLGNHDERIRNLLINEPGKVKRLYNLKRPDTSESPGEYVHELGYLSRLDELDIDLIDPHGKYDLAQIKLTNKLAVRHGWIARKGSGASALATLDHLGYSIIVGHTHRQSIVHQSKHEIDGGIRTVTGVEAGCMCRVEQTIGEDGRIWPNYTPAPDWSQGFVTARIHDDGFFSIDTAKYVNGVLLYGDQKYTL